MINEEILVLGAGIIGLTSSISLLKNGYRVKIWAKDLPPNTTSNVAAAFWYPYLCSPQDKVVRWSKFTHNYLQNNQVLDGASGCIERSAMELFDRKVRDPWWKEAVDSYRRLSSVEIPSSYRDGYRIEAIIMDTSIYLEYLTQRILQLGGLIVQKEVKDIDEALEESSIIVNCTGLGSYKLFQDKLLFPVRGQVLKVKKLRCDHVILDDDGKSSDLAYIIPRINDVVLGGTSQINDWNLDVDENDTNDILRKCSQLRPDVKNAEVTNIAVGLRPARSEVRLEVEKINKDKIIIHNYGHGGAGFTLSWGCARDVVGLVGSVTSLMSGRTWEQTL